MPLVIICGTPLSGKSHRAKQLYDYLSAQQTDSNGQCVLVSDEEKLSELGPNEIYKNASQEKELRAGLKSQVQRNLALPGTVVIFDAANYIKGYRYELYCLAKQFRTTYIVIECEDAPEDQVEGQLSDDMDENANKRSYSRQIFTELVQRFETPDANNRWDSPLFRVNYQEAALPYQDIADALLKRAALKPNQSTQSMPVTTDNFLGQLDSQAQEIIKQIQAALQRDQLRNIPIANCDVRVNLVKKISIAELNRLRRQFINYTRLQPLDDKDRIASSFVQFINKSVS